MQGFEPFAPVVGSARRFAVDRDELVPPRPERRDPAVETAAEQGRVDPIDEGAQPALARNAVMELGEPAQKGEMVLAPGDDVVEIVAGRDRGAGHQQQDLLERIHDPPGLALIPEFGKMLQKQAQARPRGLLVNDRLDASVHARAPGITVPPSTQNRPLRPVNLTSEPWRPRRPRWPARRGCGISWRPPSDG